MGSNMSNLAFSNGEMELISLLNFRWVQKLSCRFSHKAYFDIRYSAVIFLPRCLLRILSVSGWCQWRDGKGWECWCHWHRWLVPQPLYLSACLSFVQSLCKFLFLHTEFQVRLAILVFGRRYQRDVREFRMYGACLRNTHQVLSLFLPGRQRGQWCILHSAVAWAGACCVRHMAFCSNRTGIDSRLPMPRWFRHKVSCSIGWILLVFCVNLSWSYFSSNKKQRPTPKHKSL